MNCRTCRQKLSPYLEKDLPSADQAAVKSHLSGCSGCRQEMEALRQRAGHLKAAPSAPVPPEFRKQAWALKLPVGALATAAVALLVVQVTRVTVPASKLTDLNLATQGRLDEKAPSIPPNRSKSSELESAKMQRIYTPSVTHLRLRVKHPADAQETLARLAAELPIQRIERPLPTRYYLFVRQTQWNSLMEKLLQIGEPQPAPASEAPPTDLRPADLSSQAVILDLIF